MSFHIPGPSKGNRGADREIFGCGQPSGACAEPFRARRVTTATRTSISFAMISSSNALASGEDSESAIATYWACLRPARRSCRARAILGIRSEYRMLTGRSWLAHR